MYKLYRDYKLNHVREPIISTVILNLTKFLFYGFIFRKLIFKLLTIYFICLILRLKVK